MVTEAIKHQTERMSRVFEAQQTRQYEVARTSAKQRSAKLKRLYDTLLKYQDEIREAVYKDFKKPAAEVDLSELYPVLSEIRHARRHLGRWMRPKRLKTPIAHLGASSKIMYEPKGVCLIIAPWNYPLNLTLGPVVSAIAAGNTLMVKPSENTPHSSAIMRKMIEEVFEEDEVAMFEGAVETSTELLKLPFNHIFFTGAPSIGKVVMEAAAKNLASVTLELGGKSPTIIDESANLKSAVGSLAWGKFSNTGQTCVAPDYLYVHEAKMDAFLRLMKEKVGEYYGENPEDSDSYGRLVNERHFKRVMGLVDQSVAQGARVVLGGKGEVQDKMIQPTLVVDPPLDSPLMQEEIFGPVLPVLSYKNLDEVIAHIRQGEKPLALYIYSQNSLNVRKVLQETRSGTASVNNVVIHFSNNNLPFGGSNNSGIGKSHGYYGFLAFSNEKALYQQHFPSALKWLMPPYNDFKSKLIQVIMRYL